MREVRERIIGDAREYYVGRVVALKGLGTIEEAFAAWLLGKEYLPLLDPASGASKAGSAFGAARTYREVALLGYVVSVLDDAGSDIKKSLRSGLEWLSGRAAFAQASPSFEVDGLALLGIALGAETCGIVKVKNWMAGFLGKSASSRIKIWDRGLMSAAACSIGQPDLVPMPKELDLADLRVALHSRGLDVKVEQQDEAGALKVILNQVSCNLTPMRCAVQLRVLDWVIHEASSIDMSRPTVEQVLQVLERVPSSMKRWRWSQRGAKGGNQIRWRIENEYHVQDLLWVILSPLFPDLEDEENLPSLGHKHPRCDLGIPSLHLIIEVKFVHKGTQSEFAKLTEEIAADHTLYRRAGSLYDKIIVFVWDNSCSVEQHAELKQGLTQMAGIVGAVIMSRPAKMKGR